MFGLKRALEANSTDDNTTIQKRLRHEDNTIYRRSLSELLDFTSVDAKPDIETRFDEIAHSLLHHHRLCLKCDTKSVLYDLLEVEFYLHKPGYEDPFTHGSDEQKVAGHWYFHRAPRRSSKIPSEKPSTSTTGYRGGTRKGLDLTMGGPISSPHFSASSSLNPSDSVRGGILLRSIRKVSDQRVISGPSLLVDEILEQSDAANIVDLVNTKWSKDTSAFRSSHHHTALFINSRDSSPSSVNDMPRIYQSPRVGLDLSHAETKASLTHPRVVFISRPYRYFVHPALLTANGRIQTFLGVYRALIMDLSIGTNSDVTFIRDEISQRTGLKRSVVDRYIDSMRQGKEDRLDTFVGSAGKNISSSSKLYPRLMGLLSWGT